MTNEKLFQEVRDELQKYQKVHFMLELVNIQHKLKAPKGQYNSFGKYKYRSAEDILEAVKPLLAEEGCHLTISDDIIHQWGRVYVKATARIIANDGRFVETTAFAREAIDKKGMDEAQITWSASSYARKYALNWLLCIDDTKDSDTTNIDGGASEREGKKKVEDDDKQWFNDYHFDKWVESTDPDKPQSSQAMREHFKVSKEMAEKIDNFISSQKE